MSNLPLVTIRHNRIEPGKYHVVIDAAGHTDILTIYRTGRSCWEAWTGEGQHPNVDTFEAGQGRRWIAEYRTLTGLLQLIEQDACNLARLGYAKAASYNALCSMETFRARVAEEQEKEERAKAFDAWVASEKKKAERAADPERQERTVRANANRYEKAQEIVEGLPGCTIGYLGNLYTSGPVDKRDDRAWYIFHANWKVGGYRTSHRGDLLEHARMMQRGFRLNDTSDTSNTDDTNECKGHPAGPYDPVRDRAICDGSCRR